MFGALILIPLGLLTGVCSSEECVPPPPLGMTQGLIEDRRISASSESFYYPARNARFNTPGCWCALTSRRGEWLQVDLGRVATLTAVATQGNGNQSWVSAFNLQFSADNVTWYCDRHNGKIKEFTANTDGDSSFTNTLFNPPQMRYLRFYPSGWNTNICMRVELYGCEVNPTTVPSFEGHSPGQCIPSPTTAPTTVSTLSLTSPTTEVPEPIADIKLLVPTVTKTRGLVLIRLFEHEGTTPVYHWDFGDGNTAVTRLVKVTTHRFLNAGVFEVKVTASNKINNMTAKSTIVVQDPIQTLQFTKKPAAVTPHQKGSFLLKANKGTNVTFNITFGDGYSAVIMESFKVGLGPLNVSYIYHTTGTYTISINARNRVSKSVITDEVYVENQVVGLNIAVTLPYQPKDGAKNVYLATGEEVTVIVSIQNGTDVTFDFNFGERKIQSRSSSVTFKYTVVGTSKIDVKCFNRVSYQIVEYNLPIIVQRDEGLEGLELSVAPVIFGYPSRFILKLRSGKAFLCNWNFGDGSVIQTDFSDLGTTQNHTYSETGAFLVKVSCLNRKNSSSIATMAHVQIPVSGLAVRCKSLYIPVNETATYDITIQSGSHIGIQINFDDGIILRRMQKDFINNSITLKHSFTKAGTFRAVVVAHNYLGSQTVSTSRVLVVQEPIRGVTLVVNSPVKFAEPNVKYKVLLQRSAKEPTNATCLWQFGDGIERRTKLEITYNLPQEIDHTFTSEGTYLTKANCFNQVSKINFSVEVHVYKMVMPRLRAFIKLENRSIRWRASPTKKSYFELNDEVIFHVTSQMYEVKYSWQIKVLNLTFVTTVPEFRFTFPRPGIFRVHVTIQNKLETFKLSTELIIEKRVSVSSFGTRKSTIIIRDVAQIFLQINKSGTNSCVIVNFNDTSYQIVFGGAVCRDRAGNNYVHLIHDFNKTILFDHLYSKKGIYYPSVYAFNSVSEVHQTIRVEVIVPPCAVNNLSLTDQNNTVLQTSFLKRQSISLKVNFIKDCLLSNKVEVSWSVYKVRNSRVVISVVGVKTFVIPERALDYGTHKIQATVYLYGEHVKDIYGVVKGEISHNVEILSSSLVAFINGGKDRSVGYETSFSLDGSRSYDPDHRTPFSDTRLLFKWYCKVMDNTGSYIGCYNSNYKVPFSSSKVFITDSANMLQKKTYIYRLEVSKVYRNASFEQRILIVVGAPPKVEIRCEANCEKKINPENNLVVKAVCTDCLRTSGLQYRWQFFQGDNFVENPLGNTPFGVNGASLTIVSSKLTYSQKYRIQVSVKKYGGTPGNATIYLISNEPPLVGNCSVEPLTGEAMKTQFEMVCQGWSDPDLPLTYKFMYEKDGDVSSVSSGLHPSARSMLPVGEEANDYNLQLLVRVTDALGLSNQLKLRVKVKQPENVNLSSIVGDIGEIGGSPADKDKAIQSITTLSNFLNTLADKDTSSANSASESKDATDQESPSSGHVSNGGSLGTSQPEDTEIRKAREEQIRKQKEEEKRQRTEIRDRIINQVSGINVTSLNDVSLVTNAFKQVTKQADEISTKSLETTMNSMENMKDLLTQSALSGPSASGGEMTDPKKLEDASTSVISVLGNLLGAMQSQSLTNNIRANGVDVDGDADGNADSTVDGNGYVDGNFTSNVNGTRKVSPLERKKAEMKKSISRVINMIEDVSSVVLSTKTPDDGPTLIVTDHVLVRTQRHWTKSIGNESLFLRNGEVRVAHPDQLFGDNNQTIPEVIDSVVLEFPKNPFSWDTSVNINTPVMLLQLKNIDGSPLNISEAPGNINSLMNRTTFVRPMHTFYSEEIFSLSYNSSRLPFQVHKFNRSTTKHAVYFEVYVLETEILEWRILVGFGQRPTSKQHQLSWSIFVANTTSGNAPYSYLIISDNLPGTGEYYLGVGPVLTKQLMEEWRNETFNLSYALVIYQTSCRHWDEMSDTWSMNGCKVGSISSFRKVYCRCNNTASIGSDFQLLSSIIDPPPNVVKDKAVSLKFTATTDNPTVVALISTLFGLYLIGIIWAWRKDVIDTKRAIPFSLLDNNGDDTYEYIITAYTGSRRNAGTTANVGCLLIGKYGVCYPRALYDPRFPAFQKSGVSTFLVKTDFDLGDLHSLQIWHDNSGENPSWFLSQVIVEDLTNNAKYVFLCDDWLAVESTDGTIEKELLPANPSQLQEFGYLFYKYSHLSDGHLWFSVFTRPISSSFTRIQRLSCCWFFISTIMLLNAVFIGIKEVSTPLITKDHVITGVISCVIMIPLRLGIVSIFRFAVSRPRRNSKYQNGVHENEAYDSDSMDLKDVLKQAKAIKNLGDKIDIDKNVVQDCVTRNTRDEQFSFYKNEFVLEESNDFSQDSYNCAEQHNIDFSLYDERVTLQRRKKWKLPPWSVHIAWAALAAISIISAALVSFYGFKFEEQKFLHWITSVIVSVFVDILLVQPLEVLLRALYVAIVLKEAPELCSSQPRTNLQLSICEANELGYLNENYSCDKFWFPSRLDEEVIVQARKLKLLEMKSFRMLKEIVVYLLFLMSLFVVSFGHRDSLAFPVANSVEDTFLAGTYSGTSLVEGDSLPLYWVWIEQTVLPSLSASNRNWAAGCQPESNYTMECNSILVGAARLRQIRTTPDSCSIPKLMQNVVSGCSSFHSFLGEDEANYDPGWKEPINNTGPFSDSRRFWHFRNSSDLGEMPYIGLMSTYGGGGYVIDLSPSGDGKTHLENLRKNRWIDKRTRAVFVEISIYNAQVNLFAIATFLTEWLPTNGVMFFNNVKVARLYRGNNSSMLTVACEIFMVVIMTVLIYNTLKNVYRLRRAYLSDRWNILELLTIFLFFGSLAAFFNRSRLTDKAIADLKNDQDLFVSLSPVANWDELLTYLLGCLVFFANIKLLKMIRFNHRVYVLTRTLVISCEPLSSFMVVFLIFYLAYAQLYYLVFGKSVDQYASFITTVETLFNAIMGGFDFMALEESEKVLGPIFFFTFMMSMVMILMNVFLAVLMDSFAEACEEDLQSTERECLDYLKHWIGEYFSQRRAKVKECSSDGKDKESTSALTDKDGVRSVIFRIDNTESAAESTFHDDSSSELESTLGEEEKVNNGYYNLVEKALFITQQKEAQDEPLKVTEALYYLNLGAKRFLQNKQTFKISVGADVAYLGQQLEDLDDGFTKVVENDDFEKTLFNKLLLARCQKVIRTTNVLSSNSVSSSESGLPLPSQPSSKSDSHTKVVKIYSRHMELPQEDKIKEFDF